ncbi:hypothetical protein COV04_03220 [Candidatus Uhrbacteria bacterium CG10_big_fil_rev_8_21_14_0_10_48_11]|uniref:Uncharacterized protein n=1 Tax=Candidatus Uhrbacteria bacterium CG10_big_fil_rev_8_21_14_0_10_48_11 TaxID=1975037 RepID=A0A2M8LEE0_9BACT|nr:MAG: hypothetical protein COV04_03220 [Candidatus Uhrbacteria bacterium CG10_big_fil_rev_8_21_14_0_10_48_11]
MKSRERVNQEETAESLRPQQRMEIFLGIMGSDEAREHFLELGRQYLRERRRTTANTDSENFFRQIRYSPPQRAALHNAIMEIIGRVAIQKRNPTKIERRVMNDFASREEVVASLEAYLEDKKTLVSEDEPDDDKPHTRPGPSKAAFWHRKGREH